MTYYSKTSKNSNFLKTEITQDSEGESIKTESAPTPEEQLLLDAKYAEITLPLSDFDSIISFDIYDINTLGGILNYRDAGGTHKQVRY